MSETEEITEKSVDKDLMKTKLNQIGLVFLEANLNTIPNGISLFTGFPGIAIFLYHLYEHSQSEEYKVLAEQLLEKAFEAVENDVVINTFCSGLSGLSWGIDYLNKKGFIEEEAGELFEDIEPLIQSKSFQDLQLGEYDFMHAGTGPAIYFVEREGSDEYLNKVVDMLGNIAEKGDFGVRWPHDVHRRLKHIQKVHCEYNFGLSHGIPSIISVLCLIHEKGIQQEKCEGLIRGALKFIMSQKLDETYASQYPQGIYEDQEPSGARLAWCYGDLGLGMSFWKAGEILNEQAYKKEAREMFLKAAGRRGAQENAIRDAGMCHGAAGVSHLFYRAWLYTHNFTLKEAADYWLDMALKMDTHENGLAGYCAVHMDENINDYGFLEGIAGIGLVFLTRLSEDENPDWDRMLLIN